ncbi:MAG TPA: long-chain-fatty-acid--CoA ligase, partial [Candidatus Accumulibacter sp.]|nr:long-chain-fatty-acid--CoA ligase [Accumulibacter sp.]
MMPDRIWLKNYPSGVPAQIDADRYRSIPELFEEVVAKYADHKAFHNLGRTLSYRELDGLSRDFAAFL